MSRSRVSFTRPMHRHQRSQRTCMHNGILSHRANPPVEARFISCPLCGRTKASTAEPAKLVAGCCCFFIPNRRAEDDAFMADLFAMQAGLSKPLSQTHENYFRRHHRVLRADEEKVRPFVRCVDNLTCMRIVLPKLFGEAVNFAPVKTRSLFPAIKRRGQRRCP